MIRRMKKTTIAITAAAAVLALGACSSADDDKADSGTPSTPSASATADTTTSASAAAVPARVSDPRCAAAEEQYTLAVHNGLKDKTLTLENAQTIVDGDLVFYSASLVRPDGKFESRSDVWILQGLMPTASTGGARSATEWPKSSDTLKIMPSDERVQAVDACVVNLTRG